jgi:hypothetical protein
MEIRVTSDPLLAAIFLRFGNYADSAWCPVLPNLCLDGKGVGLTGYLASRHCVLLPPWELIAQG